MPATSDRQYARTHPWITFRVDLHTLAHKTWMLLGEAESKCEHVAGVPLRPATADRLNGIYLSKGIGLGRYTRHSDIEYATHRIGTAVARLHHHPNTRAPTSAWPSSCTPPASTGSSPSTPRSPTPGHAPDIEGGHVK
jgi:hypothetical protein